MAQVLKDSVREQILASARDEFSEQGFERASMRSIAQKSSMTVGNLYRYFKNKDELSDTIVSPTYALINGLVEKLTEGRVSFTEGAPQLNATPEELREMLRSLSTGLVDIYKEHRVEVNILMMGTQLNSRLTAWFSDLIAELIAKQYGFGQTDSRVRLFARCYADAIFSGMKTMLKSAKEFDETLKNMVTIYLNSYLAILSLDIEQLV